MKLRMPGSFASAVVIQMAAKTNASKGIAANVPAAYDVYSNQVQLDQAALYGALIRIQSLGLELIEIARMASEVG